MSVSVCVCVCVCARARASACLCHVDGGEESNIIRKLIRLTRLLDAIQLIKTGWKEV